MSESGHNPLEQFEVKNFLSLPEVFGYNISFTNASAFIALAVVSVLLFLHYGSKKGDLVPGRFQSLVEMIYQFISDMVEENVGHEGKKYLPIIFSLFMFILFSNL
ncbi:MAG: F0F1 ATP synthase subunit A, partial [Pseudomonadota bacterium]